MPRAALALSRLHTGLYLRFTKLPSASSHSVLSLRKGEGSVFFLRRRLFLPRASARASSPGLSALAPAAFALSGLAAAAAESGRAGLPALSAAAEVGLASASRESLEAESALRPSEPGRGGRPLA